MTIETWSIYMLGDGSLTGVTITGAKEDVRKNTPSGCAAVRGRYDHRTTRVDLATGQVVDYVPPKPADTEFFAHVWDDDLRQWTARQTKAGRIAQHDDLLKVKMKQTESGQARALRDIALAAALGQPPPQQAVQALQRIESDVADLRSQLGKEP